MEPEIQKIIADQMKKLPKDVLAAIVSVDYKAKLQEITQRQRLLIDQAGKLEMETTLVMIGLEPLADYVENIQRELEVPLLRAKEISLDVSENIFKPIRESLRAMNEEVENAEGIEGGQIEPSLNRDQILKQVENPNLTGQSPIMSFTKSASEVPAKPTKQIAINESREIETLDEVPYQQDIKVTEKNIGEEKIEIKEEIKKETAPVSNLVETKMSGITITSQKIEDATPEVKLPPIEKKRPSSGVDPYREQIS